MSLCHPVWRILGMLKMSFAEYSLFYRALLQKRLVILFMCFLIIQGEGSDFDADNMGSDLDEDESDEDEDDDDDDDDEVAFEMDTDDAGDDEH